MTVLLDLYSRRVIGRAHEYQRNLGTLGITSSMSCRGNCYDNAVAESFFGTLRNELVLNEMYQTHVQHRDVEAAYGESFWIQPSMLIDSP